MANLKFSPESGKKQSQELFPELFLMTDFHGNNTPAGEINRPGKFQLNPVERQHRRILMFPPGSQVNRNRPAELLKQWRIL